MQFKNGAAEMNRVITTSVDDDHDEEKTTEHNLIARCRKSVAVLALDVSYY